MKFSIRSICFIGLFTAVTSVLSIMSIPTPWGVPFTLQTAAMALAGYVLEAKNGTISTIIYVLLGLIGVPVYAGMAAGPGVLLGPVGGFIFGFIVMTFLCGLAMQIYRKSAHRVSDTLLFAFLSLLGLAACHIPGILQFMFVMNRMSGSKTYTLLSAAMVASVPYLIKDICSVIGAFVVAVGIRRALGSERVSAIS